MKIKTRRAFLEAELDKARDKLIVLEAHHADPKTRECGYECEWVGHYTPAIFIPIHRQVRFAFRRFWRYKIRRKRGIDGLNDIMRNYYCPQIAKQIYAPNPILTRLNDNNQQGE